MPSFDEMLNKAVDFTALSSDPYEESRQWLKEIADSIEQHLNAGLTDKAVRIELEPGFLANMGQQIKVIVRIPDKQFRDTLFRAYIPMEGTPIALDLFGDEPVKCRDRSELDREVVAFLEKTKHRLSSYRDYAG